MGGDILFHLINVALIQRYARIFHIQSHSLKLIIVPQIHYLWCPLELYHNILYLVEKNLVLNTSKSHNVMCE